MPSQLPTATGDASPSYPACVEHGVWTTIPVEPPKGAQHLKLKDTDAEESRTIREHGVMTFHAVGCTGDFKDHLPGSQIAKAMARQIFSPGGSGGNPAAA